MLPMPCFTPIDQSKCVNYWAGSAVNVHVHVCRVLSRFL